MEPTGAPTFLFLGIIIDLLYQLFLPHNLSLCWSHSRKNKWTDDLVAVTLRVLEDSLQLPSFADNSIIPWAKHRLEA